VGKTRKTEVPLLPDRLEKINWVMQYMQVSRAYVFKLIKEEGLPCYRSGRILRFDPHAVARWVYENSH